jgi:hypothetical protein
VVYCAEGLAAEAAPMGYAAKAACAASRECGAVGNILGICYEPAKADFADERSASLSRVFTRLASAPRLPK